MAQGEWDIEDLRAKWSQEIKEAGDEGIDGLLEQVTIELLDFLELYSSKKSNIEFLTMAHFELKALKKAEAGLS